MLSEIILALLVLLSLMVWVKIGARGRQGLPPLEQAPRNPSPWLTVACVTSAAYVSLMLVMKLHLALNAAEELPPPDLVQVQWSIVNGVSEIIIALAVLTALGHFPLRDVGIHARNVGRQLRDGLFGYLASLAPVFFLAFATSPLRTPDRQHPFLTLLETNQSVEAVGCLILSAVIIAPLKEELIFRVMLQDGLARRMGSPLAIGITSILFCAVHGFPDSLALVPLAVILGYVYDRRQSVLAIVLIHALFNLTNILILLLSPSEVPL